MQAVKSHKGELKILLVAAGTYILILFLFNLWKYYTNKYNVLDLAIYNQVFWNLTHGHGLYSSIQQGHYFGDHAEFFIFLLAPIYALASHPLTLLTLQTIGLVSAVFPIYFLSSFILKMSKWRGNAAKNVSEGEQHGCPPQVDCEPENRAARAALGRATASFCGISLPLLPSLAWFINPIVWNINFFEFHILPFVVPLALWTIYFMLIERWGLYFLFLIFSLTVREDVTFIILMLGVIAMLKNRRVGLVTIIMSIGWFFGATKFIQHYSVDASYKYLSYYLWLGDSWPEIAKNIFWHPLIIIKHVISLPNFEMVLGFLLVFLFLPLWRPRFLLLAFIPLLQFILHGSGGSALILQIHYAALFLPGLIVSSIFGLKYLFHKLPTRTLAIVTIVTFASIYNLIILGPGVAAIKNISSDIQSRDWRGENEIISSVPAGTSVAATYMPLTKLSSRQNLYALHYLYVGKKQFSQESYKIPKLPDYLLIDEQELGTFKVQYESLAWSAPTAKDGFKRLGDLIITGDYGALKRAKNLVLLQKNFGKNSPYNLPVISPDLRGYIILNDIRSGKTVFSK